MVKELQGALPLAASTGRREQLSRWLYRYTFEDGAIYVGITIDPVRRRAEHLAKGKLAVRLRCQLYRFWISSRPYAQASAIRAEAWLIAAHKEAGHTVLNKMSGGSIGSTRRYTFDECAQEAKKHTARVHFHDANKRLYHAARRNGWLNEICSHMKPLKHPPSYWTYERCAAEALKYTNRLAFSRKSSGAYTAARKGDYLDAICGHIPQKIFKRRSDKGVPRSNGSAVRHLKYEE